MLSRRCGRGRELNSKRGGVADKESEALTVCYLRCDQEMKRANGELKKEQVR